MDKDGPPVDKDGTVRAHRLPDRLALSAFRASLVLMVRSSIRM